MENCESTCSRQIYSTQRDGHCIYTSFVYGMLWNPAYSLYQFQNTLPYFNRPDIGAWNKGDWNESHRMYKIYMRAKWTCTMAVDMSCIYADTMPSTYHVHTLLYVYILNCVMQEQWQRDVKSRIPELAFTVLQFAKWRRGVIDYMRIPSFMTLYIL